MTRNALQAKRQKLIWDVHAMLQRNRAFYRSVNRDAVPGKPHYVYVQQRSTDYKNGRTRNNDTWETECAYYSNIATVSSLRLSTGKPSAAALYQKPTLLQPASIQLSKSRSFLNLTHTTTKLARYSTHRKSKHQTWINLILQTRSFRTVRQHLYQPYSSLRQISTFRVSYQISRRFRLSS